MNVNVRIIMANKSRKIEERHEENETHHAAV